MAGIHGKIAAYVEKNIEEIDWLNEIIVGDGGTDGGTLVIEEWNYSAKTKPTDDQLTAVNSAGNTKEVNEKLYYLREQRNLLLIESDWTRIDDNGLSDSVKASWATYRESLRDITDSATSLDDVSWPTKPS